MVTGSRCAQSLWRKIRQLFTSRVSNRLTTRRKRTKALTICSSSRGRVWGSNTTTRANQGVEGERLKIFGAPHFHPVAEHAPTAALCPHDAAGIIDLFILFIYAALL